MLPNNDDQDVLDENILSKEKNDSTSNHILDLRFVSDIAEVSQADDDEIEEFDEFDSDDDKRMEELSDRLTLLSESISILQKANEEMANMIHLIRQENLDLSQSFMATSRKRPHLIPPLPLRTKRVRRVCWNSNDPENNKAKEAASSEPIDSGGKKPHKKSV